ncbi:MAG: redoxin domain-containing protein [Ardenticatenales bacterium]|nr:redoxin domain-containing protein [Ardenticatenales bacterium]
MARTNETTAAAGTRRPRLGMILAWTALVAAALGGGIGVSYWRANGGALGGPAPTGGDVAAEVNGVPLTTRDVDIEFAVQKDLQLKLSGKVLDASPSAEAGFRRDLTDRLIDRWLVVDAATKANIVVDDAAVAAIVVTADQRFGLPAGTVRQAILGSPFGLTEADLNRWARQQALVERYLASPEAQNVLQQWTAEHGPAQDPVDPVAQSLIAKADVKLHIDGQIIAPVREGQPAPEFELPGPDGTLHKLSDFKGQAVMLNFWATWCAPCRAEIPLFVNAYEKNKAELVVLGVNSQETPELVTPFMQSFKISYPMVIDGVGTTSSIYRVKALPTTFFVDANGIVVKAVRGTIHNRPELNEYLDQILDTPISAARTLGDRLALSPLR